MLEMDLLHADYAKIKAIVDNSQEKYVNKGLIRDDQPKQRFGLSEGLEYTHFKKKEKKFDPVIEEQIEEEKKEAEKVLQA